MENGRKLAMAGEDLLEKLKYADIPKKRGSTVTAAELQGLKQAQWRC
jgi:hypothetical protein